MLGGVERLDHLLELADLRPGAAVARIAVVRREEVEGHVAPVIPLLRVELLHRQQLDHVDAEFLEVRNLLDHAPIRAAACVRHAGVAARRESLDVHLIHHRLRPVPGMMVVAPIEMVVRVADDPERRLAVIPSRHARRLAAMAGRKVDGVRIRDRGVPYRDRSGGPGRCRAARPRGTRNTLPARRSRLGIRQCQTRPVLLPGYRSSMRIQRVHRIAVAIEQQSDGGGVIRVHGEVVGFLLLDVRDAAGRRRSLQGVPIPRTDGRQTSHHCHS